MTYILVRQPGVARLGGFPHYFEACLRCVLTGFSAERHMKSGTLLNAVIIQC